MQKVHIVPEKDLTKYNVKPHYLYFKTSTFKLNSKLDGNIVLSLLTTVKLHNKSEFGSFCRKSNLNCSYL